MQISIKILQGETLTVDVQPTNTILTVKRMIEVQNAMPPAEQILTLSGKPLEDERSLAEYGVRDGARLHLMRRLRQ